MRVPDRPASRPRNPTERRERRLAREEFWDSAKSMTPYVALERHDGVFLLPTSIEPDLFVKEGRTEFVVLARALEALRRAERVFERRTFVDVGAHIGTTTIPAVAAHGFERAVAIEPDPDALTLLHANLQLNGVAENVTVVEAAVTDTEGEAAFRQGTRTEDVHRWMKGRLVEDESEETVPVTTVTLDGLVREGVVDIDATDLLWFDCAGREDEALASGESFLERRVPIVFTVRQSAVEHGHPLFKRLRAVYETAVDLRQPSLGGEVKHWKPPVRGIEKLRKFELRSKLTDVLVY
jgi:FkbM family methyltransferase